MKRGSMDPEGYYDEFGMGEWERLEQNPVARLEFETTVSMLETYLPGDGRVLDAGGGPGRYSIWLAERGYEVEHVDLSSEQVRIAREKAAEHEVSDRVTCSTGDVRDLDFEDRHFDAVCCLGGPISHILNADEREVAVQELGRVAKPAAPVFVSVIGRLAALQYGIRHGLDVHPEILPELAASGDYTQELMDRVEGDGWAECHFFRVAEFESLLESANLTVERIVGLEGLASVMQPELESAPMDAIEAVEEVVKLLLDDRSVADVSEHVLAVCRV